MTRRKIFTAAALIVALSRAVGTAEAAPQQKAPEKAAADVRARELFLKGDAAYAEGRYEEAYAAFQEAYDLSGRPQLLFNISNALERLGKYSEALDALEKYLASGKAKDREVVQKRLANLRKRVEDQKKLEETAKEEEEKKRAAEEKKKEPPADEKVDVAPPRPPPPPEKPTPVLPIVTLGAGAAALATAGVFGILTLSARSDVDAGCKDGPAGRLCNADVSSAIDRDKTFGLVTDIALVSGVVLGGVGVYLLLSGSRRPVVHGSSGSHATHPMKVGSRWGRASTTKEGASTNESRAPAASAPNVRIEARPAGAGFVVVGSF